MNKNRLWLLILILITLALRLTLLGRQSFWYDEGITWLLSCMSPLELIRWTAADIQPPLYYLLMSAATRLFGQSEWALRFPSAICGLLTMPLIYILASRLFSRSRLTPIFAAGLLAISPVMVYYSQEARMYTLLVFEATLAGYLLLKILQPPSPSAKPVAPSRLAFQPTSVIYALTITAALYTHYFAVFLLVAHGLYFLFILRQRGFPRYLWRQLLQIPVMVVLLFAPWISVLFARWGDDPSYWPGSLKLDEVLRKVLISFTAGETVFEQTGFYLALGYLLLLIIPYATLAIQKIISIIYERFNRPGHSAENHSTHYKSSTLFLLLWLLLPITLILLLSYQSPKFNPRYTLLSWPAFALILAASLTNLAENVTPSRRKNNRPLPHSSPPPTSPLPTLPPSALPPLPPSPLPFASPPPIYPLRVPASRTRFAYPLRVLSLLFILAVSAFSLYNWFGDPRFAKDDFRALAQFARERIAPDETILLSSGHMFPVWMYYYEASYPGGDGRQGWTPLPRMERLDISKVTNLTIATEMAQALQGKGGVWLVSWQDEVIDPNGVVPFWLDRIGHRPHDAGDFKGARLEHWRLDPNKLGLLSQSPIEHPAIPPSTSKANPASGETLYYNFANQVDLLGLTQLSDTEVALFWRPRRPLPDNLLLTFSLTDKDGFSWDQGDFVGRPGAYLYPPSRWPVGEIVLTRQHLSWQTGSPPGLYQAKIGLGQSVEQANNLSSSDFSGWDVLDEQGRPLRRTALIDFIELRHLVQPSPDSPPLPEPPPVDFWPVITLRQSELSSTTAEPGDRLLLALLWQAGESNLDDISLAFDLIDAQGRSFQIGSSSTPSRNFNLPRWKPKDVVKGQYWLDIPPEAAPGPATLQARLSNIQGSRYDKSFPFEKLEILPTQRNFTPPAAIDMPLEADFSGQVALISADCRPSPSPDTAAHSACRALPGQSVTLTFYWRAKTRLDTNYTVFTHLLGPDETSLMNIDHTPPKPTRGWVNGEIIADTITLTLPADLPPNDYRIEVGLYNAADPNFPRLPLSNGENRVILPQPLKVE